MKVCIKCGACDRYPSGRCRACALARTEQYKVAPPASKAERARRVAALLRESPLSRSALEALLGVSQQTVAEALRHVGARVVGHEPRHCRGRPMPIYALAEAFPAPRSIRAVSSVWELGSHA